MRGRCWLRVRVARCVVQSDVVGLEAMCPAPARGMGPREISPDGAAALRQLHLASGPDATIYLHKNGFRCNCFSD